MMWLFPFLAIGVMGLGCVAGAREVYKRRREFMEMPTVSVAELAIGHFAVEGEIVVLRDRLQSPLSQQECVFFSFGARDYKFAGKRLKPTRVASDRRSVIFGVRDQTGIVEVNLEKVKPICSTPLSVPDRRLSDEARRTISLDYGVSGAATRYSESTLRPGEHVYVCGDVTRTANGELRFSAALRSNRRLRVSACGKEALLGDVDLGWKHHLVLGIVCLMVSLAATCTIVFCTVYKIPLP